MKTKLTTMEKTLKVKEDMANKKFSSIEDACKHYKLSPASYYNYSKKPEALPQRPTTANNWILEVETLRKENELLKRAVEESRVRMFKLERKLVSISLGEATI